MSRPGIVTIDEYLNLPREPQTWLIKPLIPMAGAALLYSPPKVGKALSLETPVLTPLGWRTIKDIQPQDEVYGYNGKAIKVLAISPVCFDRPCYKITFNDSSSCVVDAGHEWTVNTRDNAKPVTLTTEDMLKCGIYCEQGSRYKRHVYRISLPKAIEFSKSKSILPIPPYGLGLWLGDGNSGSSGFTTADLELVAAWEQLGYDIRKTCGKYAYTVPGLITQLKVLGLNNNKHIPHEYMTASIEERKELLAGLLDTDGFTNGGTAEFSNMNKQLAHQVYDLAVQLGCKVKIVNKEAHLYDKPTGTCYTVRIRANFNPFKLSRKAARFKLNQEEYKTITAIDPVETVPVKCLVVDTQDHLFLVGRACTPTHNSYLGIQLALAISDPTQDKWLDFPVTKHGPVIYLQLDTPRSVWSARFDELKSKGVKWSPNAFLADRETLDYFPFDVLIPSHMKYLHDVVQPIQPVAVIVDTLREAHSGDEDSSTVARNVIANLVGAISPAALIIISPNRKPNPEAQNDLMADHRGSGYIVGRMDAVLRLTKHRMYFSGRAIEEGDIKLQRLDSGLWAPITDDSHTLAEAILMDPSFGSMRDRARALAPKIAKTEDAAMSMLRRMIVSKQASDTLLTQQVDTAAHVQNR